MKTSTIDRFLNNIEKIPFTTCWIYTGTILKEYGQISFYCKDENKYRQKAAHRVSYEYFKEPIPEDLVIDHLCKVKCCVNPDHLEPVTDKINILRGNGIASQNSKRLNCSNCNSEFTVDKKGMRRCDKCVDRRRKEWVKRNPEKAKISWKNSNKKRWQTVLCERNIN